MSKQKLIINKTGFEMFDAFRAYGLAFLISGFENEPAVYIRDYEYAYVVDVHGDIPRAPDSKIFEETNNAWSLVFKTFKERKDLKVKPPREDAKHIAISDYKKIIDLHRRIDFVPEISNDVKDGRTLYQTMDVSAAKGYREEKRSVYHEGSQLKVDKYSWCVAAIGAAWFGFWPVNLMRKDTAFLLFMVPNPRNVLLISHRAVHEKVDKQLCIISTNTALAHYSIKLVKAIIPKAQEVYYDNVIYNVMQKTGQQPKPGGGGKFNLDFLEKIAQKRAGYEALETIDRYLLPVNPKIKGVRQDLALAISDFLLRPTLSNFKKFESLYIRGQVKRELYAWVNDQLEELLAHVEVA